MTHWTVVYSHGRDGSPWEGNKISAIKPVVLNAEINLVSIRYHESDMVPQMIDQAVETCLNKDEVPGRIILIGSSRGAYINAAVSQILVAKTGIKSSGLLMLAPAIGIKPDYYPEHFPVPQSKLIHVIHPYGDEVVPFQNVVEFCASHAFPLQLVEDEHNLSHQTELIARQVATFLETIKTQDL